LRETSKLRETALLTRAETLLVAGKHEMHASADRGETAQSLRLKIALGSGMNGDFASDYPVGLRALLAFDDVELNFVAFFQGFVPVNLDRRVMDKNVGPVISSNESIALRVVEPLHFPFVLSHRLLPS
jgi:hypothetical protein